MHWTVWIVFFALLLEMLRGIANVLNIVWLQAVLNQEVFAHIGNVDNAFFITIVPLIVIRLLRIRNRKFVVMLLTSGIVVSIYAVFDEEILLLPLLNTGVPNLLDIPAGCLGWFCGVLTCRRWLKARGLLEQG